MDQLKKSFYIDLEKRYWRREEKNDPNIFLFAKKKQVWENFVPSVKDTYNQNKVEGHRLAYPSHKWIMKEMKSTSFAFHHVHRICNFHTICTNDGEMLYFLQNIEF